MVVAVVVEEALGGGHKEVKEPGLVIEDRRLKIVVATVGGARGEEGGCREVGR